MISLIIFTILLSIFSNRNIVEDRYSTTGMAIRLVLLLLYGCIAPIIEFVIIARIFGAQL